MLRIRLSKIGKTNSPTYRVVVMEKRSHQRGKTVDCLGYFDPTNPKKTKINKERINYWEKMGAETAESIKKMIDQTYKFKIYSPVAKNPKQ